MVLQCNLNHGVGDSAVLKNASEAAAAADEQGDRGSWRETLVAESEDGVPADAAHHAEHDEADEHADKKGHVVVADETHELIGGRPAPREDVGPTAGEHKGNGKKDASDGEPEAGKTSTGVVIGEILGHGVLGGHFDPRGDDPSKQW